MNTNTTDLAGGFTCGAIEDNKLCGGELFDGKTYSPIHMPLCYGHAANLYNWSVGLYRVKLVAKMEEEGILTEHLSGWTYVIELPNGRIKIGTSGTSKGVVDRWRHITREYLGKGYREPLKPLALIPGGVTREATLHNRFKDLRVMDELGEQFLAEPELVDYVKGWGIPEDMQSLVAGYENYWKTKQAQF